jgi:hypothetical protein
MMELSHCLLFDPSGSSHLRTVGPLDGLEDPILEQRAVCGG